MITLTDGGKIKEIFKNVRANGIKDETLFYNDMFNMTWKEGEVFKRCW